jgi:hypothetical protein
VDLGNKDTRPVMSEDPKETENTPSAGISDDLRAVDRAMLLALSHHQRKSISLSLDQERLLDRWIAGTLTLVEADAAAELTKHNKFAAERVLERRLIAAANEGPEVPSAWTARILRASRAPEVRSGGIFNLRWPSLSGWQLSGLSAAVAATAVVAVFGFQAWQGRLSSDKSFQIAMVTIEDRGVLLEGTARTRGSPQQAASRYTSLNDKPAEGRFRDIDIPTALLRRAITSATTNKGDAEYTELMNYLRAQNEAFDNRARILVDSALADSLLKNKNESTNIQIRVYDLDDLRAASIRSKILTLQVDAHAILLTLR